MVLPTLQEDAEQPQPRALPSSEEQGPGSLTPCTVPGTGASQLSVGESTVRILSCLCLLLDYLIYKRNVQVGVQGKGLPCHSTGYSHSLTLPLCPTLPSTIQT